MPISEIVEKSMVKKIRHESITVEVEGCIYEGERIIEGIRSCSQRVSYEGVTEYDNTYYKSAEAGLMDGIARGILFQLVLRKRRAYLISNK